MNFEIHSGSKAVLTHLSVQQEGQEYTIGDPLLSKFIRVPEPAVLVIELADGSRTLQEIKELLQQEKGIDVDVADFVAKLLALGLVFSIDGRKLVNYDTSQVPRQESWQVRLGRILFHKWMSRLYMLNVVAIILLYAFNPSLLPHFRDAFLLNGIGANALLIFVISSIQIVIHESGHYLAAVSRGVKSNIRFSIRYVFVAVETQMTGLWAHPKRKRYLPYLAGMAWDCTLLLICLLVQMSAIEGTFVYGLSRLIALALFFSVLSQFLFFLRTDVYYVVVNWTNSANLHQSSKTFLRSWLPYKREESKGQWERLPSGEKRAAKVFSLFYIFGFTTLTFMIIAFTIPASVTGLSMAFHQVADFAFDSVSFWDGAIILLLMLTRVTLYVIGARNVYRDRRIRRRELKAAGVR
ncbi:PqqD family protein [Paenibacillus nanensis]|uniref:PqqD family protein n=1 Tax=Paenibacillus nanensis TaxID=393251 RepID=A0A3A1VFF9_9BACL|nr:PqqD family protein [Paenibacillus nanensis]RIX59648.1 PqqD family protein [Paenibacillus nanensis]